MTGRAVVLRGRGGGGGSYPSMQNRRGDVQEGKCPFTHKISLTHLIENVHSLTRVYHKPEFCLGTLTRVLEFCLGKLISVSVTWEESVILIRKCGEILPG